MENQAWWHTLANANTQKVEAKAGGLGVQSHPQLHGELEAIPELQETLSQKKVGEGK